MYLLKIIAELAALGFVLWLAFVVFQLLIGFALIVIAGVIYSIRWVFIKVSSVF